LGSDFGNPGIAVCGGAEGLGEVCPAAEVLTPIGRRAAATLA